MDDPRTNGSLSVQAALDVLGGQVRANQPQPWTPAGFALERDRQVEELSACATEHQWLIRPEDLGPRHSGRMEHSIFGSKQDGELVFKATKGQKFGFWPYCPPNIVSSMADECFEMRPATPAQYLQRLHLMDQLSPGLNGLAGFTHLNGLFSIVTTQRWYDARNATWKEINTYLRSMGFRPVRSDAYDDPTRWFHPTQNIALFDVGQSNILICGDELVPIDIVPIMPDTFMRERLIEFMKEA